MTEWKSTVNRKLFELVKIVLHIVYFTQLYNFLQKLYLNLFLINKEKLTLAIAVMFLTQVLALKTAPVKQ